MVSSENMQTTDTGSNYILLACALIAGLFIVGAVVWNNSRTPQAAPQANIADVSLAGEPFIGNADALPIAVWSDFQCPYCKSFEFGALPDIMKEYVDSGKVKVVFKDVVFLSPRMGSDSLTGAVYNQAVWKLYPNKYFEWRTAVFNAQDEENGGFGSAESIDELNATIAGLDAAKIKTDVAANRQAYEKHASDVTTEAQRLGVRATPSLTIGMQLVQGAQPYATFKAAIEEVLQP
jgi:protein-disulfide isomerase